MYQSPNQSAAPQPQQPSLTKIVIRWLIASLAIFAAISIVPGIDFSGPGWQIGIVALIFGFFNVLLRPLLLFVTCPIVFLTLGLFNFVISALILGLTSAFAGQLGIDFVVAGFWPGFFGGMVVSLVSTLLSALTGDIEVQVVRK